MFYKYSQYIINQYNLTDITNKLVLDECNLTFITNRLVLDECNFRNNYIYKKLVIYKLSKHYTE